MAFLDKTGLARLWANITTLINTKVDKVEGKELSTNDFTDAYKEKLEGLENIKFEESDPTVPAWAKAATKPSYTAKDVGALPTSTVLADLSADPYHRTVTDAEKTSWNAKSNFSGNYNDLEDAPSIEEDDTGTLVIADSDGNIIFLSDSNGVATTTVNTKTLILNGAELTPVEWKSF